MDETKLARLQERLAEMNTRNDELRQALEQRATELTAVAEGHKEALDHVGRQVERLRAQQAGELRTLAEHHKYTLEKANGQLEQLRAEQAAEVKTHQAETAALQRRREELKQDYGDIHELVGQLQKTEPAKPAEA